MNEILPVPLALAKNFYKEVLKKEPEIAAHILKVYGKAYSDFYTVCRSGSFRKIYEVAQSIEKAIPVMPHGMPEERDLAVKHLQLKSMLKNMNGNRIGKPTEEDIEKLREHYHSEYGI